VTVDVQAYSTEVYATHVLRASDVRDRCARNHLTAVVVPIADAIHDLASGHQDRPTTMAGAYVLLTDKERSRLSRVPGCREGMRAALREADERQAASRRILADSVARADLDPAAIDRRREADAAVERGSDLTARALRAEQRAAMSFIATLEVEELQAREILAALQRSGAP